MSDQDNHKKNGADQYSRVDFRRSIAWPQRIEREAQLLRLILERAPHRSVIDIGCGTGEHSRFLAAEGHRVVGIDKSEAMIEQAGAEPVSANIDFLLCGINEIDDRLTEKFGAAICLGNTLVHLTTEAEMRQGLASIAAVLVGGGVLLIQILNYERIFRHNIRHLPLNFRRQGGKEIIFLRLMEPLKDGRVRFCPTTLEYDPDGDPPLRAVRSRIVDLYGWRAGQLREILASVGWNVEDLFGDVEQNPYDAQQSPDLVIVARKRG